MYEKPASTKALASSSILINDFGME